MADKVLPGNETVALFPAVVVNGVPHFVGAAAIAPLNKPTIAILNYWLAITKPSQLPGGAGGNISCAIMDDLDLGPTDSDTDSDRTICSVGKSEELTFYNFEASITGLRDEDEAGDGVYNLFRNLTRAPDVPYIIGHRIGAKQTAPAIIGGGEEWDFYYAHTDNPVNGYSDGGNQTIEQKFVPKNLINLSHSITA